MIFDYSSEYRKLILIEEPGEDLLRIKDKTDYILCERIRNGRHEIPFVMFPKLWKIAGKLGFRTSATDKLKSFYRAYEEKRKILEQVKENFHSCNFPIIARIKAFCEKIEKLYNFKYMPEQIESIVYLVIAKKALLANEVGTGKSLVMNTTCKFLISEKKIKKVLVLLPASLVKNYADDYKKFFGNYGMISIGDETKPKREAIYASFRRSTDTEFLITNYEKCRIDIEFLSKIKFDAVLVDEFHRMKNYREAAMSANFFKMLNMWKSEYRFPASGTPIENKLLDLYPIFKLLQDGFILGNSTFFDNNFVEYEDVFFKQKVGGRTFTRFEKKAVGFKENHLPFLKELVRPFVIRKKLSLPCGLYEQIIRIDLSKKVRDKYHEIRQTTTGPSAKYHAVRQFLCDVRRGDLKPEDNPKCEELKNILSQTDSKVLIFSFYKCSIDAISDYVRSLGYSALTLKGDDGKDPFEEIQKFRNGNDKCLVASDRINYGHNLQNSKVVIHWELPIKPTTYTQRNGRSYRTGQTEDVHVYSFVCNDTVEGIIADSFESKRHIIREMIEKMDDKGLAEIEKEIEKKVLQSLE